MIFFFHWLRQIWKQCRHQGRLSVTDVSMTFKIFVYGRLVILESPFNIIININIFIKYFLWLWHNNINLTWSLIVGMPFSLFYVPVSGVNFSPNPTYWTFRCLSFIISKWHCRGKIPWHFALSKNANWFYNYFYNTLLLFQYFQSPIRESVRIMPSS